MTASGQIHIEKKLIALQAKLKQQLPSKIDEIEEAWAAFKKDDTGLATLHRLMHGLVGTGGTFGAVNISSIASSLECTFKSLLNEAARPLSLSKEVQHKIEGLLDQLTQAADDWQPSTITYINPIKEKTRNGYDLVYLVDDDELLAANLVAKIAHAGFRVRHFIDITDFEAAFKKETPAVILMDVVFKEGDIAGTEVISRLQANEKVWPPVIFISVRKDMEARLAAARAGATHYFCKPLDIDKLIYLLDDLIERKRIKPFQILLIDDDKTLLEYYAAILSEAGMNVKTLSNPMEGLTILSEFKPDVVVMDIYMKGCSGPELAQVIRQDDTLAMIPIIYLSTETSLRRQLAAMNIGGDVFLLKPVEAGNLVSIVVARAKRARWLKRINNDLENALRESKFQLVTMDQHDIVSITDIGGQITHVNGKFCDISGYSHEELLGQNHRILKSGYHPNSFYEEMWATISQGKVWHGTICNRKKNGDEYWVESTIVPFLDKRGKPYKYISARTDVTQLKISEDRLERSQVYADVGTWDWDIRKDEVYWSDHVKKLYGYAPDFHDLTLNAFYNSVHPDDLNKVKHALNACLEEGIKYDIEHRVIWPDGSVRWLLERGDVMRNEVGKPLRMSGVVQDVTERVLASTRQRESEERFAFAVEGAGDGVWDWDISSNVMQFSQLYMEMLGYVENELPNHIDTWVNCMHPDNLEIVQENLQAYLKGTKPAYEAEFRLRCKDGSYKWILCRGTIVKRDSEGEPLRMIGINSDISSRKETEKNLISAREEAENANRAKSRFLSNMSHELRTPMNAIIGFGQLLKIETDQPLTESQLDNVNEITRAANHLLELINEILDLARIEAGRIDLSIETVALGEVVSESLQLIMPLSQKRGIEINIIENGIDITFDQLFQQSNNVWADRIRLRQVLLNLLSNAVKYNCENGKLTVNLEQAENNHTRISISDTGNGISLEQQKQLFKPFNRLGVDQANVEGTGIGLVISKNIIELMGGSIGVDSELDKGSTFWIKLPGDMPSSSEELTPVEKEPAPLSSPFLHPEHEYTVLYIEDNPANLRLVMQLLGRLPNIHMWSAHEPTLGLDLVEEHKPDLILLDINLPGMNGFEALKILRQSKTTQNIPVIAISANALPEDIEKGINAGFDDYITKPIDVTAFLKVVKKILFEPENEAKK